MAEGQIRIGISGWRYKGWRGVFYPKELRQKDELAFAAGAFPTIEINGTFYSLQRPPSFRRWREETPADFVFALKGPRYLTHMRKLREPKAALANFFASGVLLLKEKLGPVLWQLPPSFRFDAARLEQFFAHLPRSHAEAARLARQHEPKLKGRAWTRAGHDGPIRHALEIRHDSFRDPAFIALLRRHRIGLVVADTVAWPLLMDVTADFVYCRLHGSEQLYTSGYDAAALARWAGRVRAWAAGRKAQGTHAGAPDPSPRPRDVYVYFDNDAKVRAPFDAKALMARLGLQRNAPAARTLASEKEERMAKPSPRQRRTEGRVMHEFKHGELKSGPGGRAGKVKSRKQAIAIALSEAGASKYQSARENHKSRARTIAKESKGQTAQQTREGKSHLGAKGRRESSRAEGGKDSRHRTQRGKRAARARSQGGPTKQELYAQARQRSIPNRSKMSKTQLQNALRKR